jgi:hypothetical protein
MQGTADPRIKDVGLLEEWCKADRHIPRTVLFRAHRFTLQHLISTGGERMAVDRVFQSMVARFSFPSLSLFELFAEYYLQQRDFALAHSIIATMLDHPQMVVGAARLLPRAVDASFDVGSASIAEGFYRLAVQHGRAAATPRLLKEYLMGLHNRSLYAAMLAVWADMQATAAAAETAGPAAGAGAGAKQGQGANAAAARELSIQRSIYAMLFLACLKTRSFDVADQIYAACPAPSLDAYACNLYLSVLAAAGRTAQLRAARQRMQEQGLEAAGAAGTPAETRSVEALCRAGDVAAALAGLQGLPGELPLALDTIEALLAARVREGWSAASINISTSSSSSDRGGGEREGEGEGEGEGEDPAVTAILATVARAQGGVVPLRTLLELLRAYVEGAWHGRARRLYQEICRTYSVAGPAANSSSSSLSASSAPAPSSTTAAAAATTTTTTTLPPPPATTTAARPAPTSVSASSLFQVQRLMLIDASLRGDAACAARLLSAHALLARERPLHERVAALGALMEGRLEAQAVEGFERSVCGGAGGEKGEEWEAAEHRGGPRSRRLPAQHHGVVNAWVHKLLQAPVLPPQYQAARRKRGQAQVQVGSDGAVGAGAGVRVGVGGEAADSACAAARTRLAKRLYDSAGSLGVAVDDWAAIELAVRLVELGPLQQERPGAGPWPGGPAGQ